MSATSGKKYDAMYYSITPKEFNSLLEDRVKCSDALWTLNEHLSQGKGLCSTWEHPDKGHIVLNKKQLRNAKDNYNKQVLIMGKYHKNSLKKSRFHSEPESFSGVYSPVYAAEALTAFFSGGNFGPLSPLVARHPTGSIAAKEEIARILDNMKQAEENYKTALATYDLTENKDSNSVLKFKLLSAKQEHESFSNHRKALESAGGDLVAYEQFLRANITEVLQLVKTGYILHNTITMLFFIYTHANQLQKENAQFTKSDAHMDAAFEGKHPAAFYTSKVGGKKTLKITMNEAVAQGIVSEPLNTYAIISKLFPPGHTNKSGTSAAFDKNDFNTYYFQSIASLNYFSREDMADLEQLLPALNYIETSDAKQVMLLDHNIIKAVSKEWATYLEPMRKKIKESKAK